MRSFNRNGTPRKGPFGSGPRAESRAFSNMGVTTAQKEGFNFSMRAIAASTNSRGVICLRCTRSACAVASRSGSSSFKLIHSSSQTRCRKLSVKRCEADVIVRNNVRPGFIWVGFEANARSEDVHIFVVIRERLLHVQDDL